MGSTMTASGTTTSSVSVPRTTKRPHPPPYPTSPLNCSLPCGYPCPPPSNGTTVTSILTLLSLTTTMTSTISSNFISTTTITSFSVTAVLITPTNNPAITAALAAETSLLNNNAALTKGNTAAASVLGTIAILLIIGIALFFFFWVRRRRTKNGDNESPPLTSMAPNRPLPVVSFRPGTAQSIISAERPATSLSMGPRGAGYGAAALKSHPIRPALAKRSSSAPNLKPPDRPPRIPTLRGLPSINIMPNTPSSRALDPESPPPSPATPILQQGARRMPLYHEALQEEAERTRSRIEAENAGRLGLPIIERNRSQRGSVDTIGSDMERFAGGNGGNGGGNGGNGGSGGRREGVLHSTRASSGIFPEGDEEKEGEENWSSRGSRGSGSKKDEKTTGE
ncbi:hypothetical protein G7Y89_g2784 [Cudoniella acicularis]|uniref:Uncharacterized protein n=1 Tax=Cudoniella acicularis TaxID=354080 RepID=A0A8H4W6M7_9HELO|nr:hypothetical protein G7Y89_g2784 [Cudoniella acicularis]